MDQHADPFGLLVELANLSLSVARGLPAQVEAAPTWTGIGFMLAEQRMVAPMAEVAELIPMPASTSLPGVKSWVRGVSNVRGRLLPLVDLEAFFGGQLVGSSKSRRVLAVEKGDLYSGLIVSEVVGMLHFPVDSFIEKIPSSAAPLAAYCLGSYVHDQAVWTVFSPHRLAADHRFINAAA